MPSCGLKAEEGRILMVPTTETVWEEFNTGLKRFILKHVQDEPSAEDILQDVFLKIHSHIGSLKESDKLQGWIYQIARNAITDFYRAHKFTPDLPEIAYVPEDPFRSEERRVGKEC